jgi:hypothetical protein
MKLWFSYTFLISSITNKGGKENSSKIQSNLNHSKREILLKLVKIFTPQKS